MYVHRAFQTNLKQHTFTCLLICFLVIYRICILYNFCIQTECFDKSLNVFCVQGSCHQASLLADGSVKNSKGEVFPVLEHWVESILGNNIPVSPTYAWDKVTYRQRSLSCYLLNIEPAAPHQPAASPQPCTSQEGHTAGARQGPSSVPQTCQVSQFSVFKHSLNVDCLCQLVWSSSTANERNH